MEWIITAVAIIVLGSVVVERFVATLRDEREIDVEEKGW